MVNKKNAIILLGAPGSGKGTQGEILEKNIKYKRYVMSSILKKELKPGSEKFEKISRGELLSNTDIFDIFKKNFKSENNIIIDGIPRTEDQAYWLYGYLLRHKYNIKLVFINVDESKLLKRILKRAKLENRSDDNSKVFADRLRIFDEVKLAILDVYGGEIIEVNGDRKIDIISKEIESKVLK